MAGLLIADQLTGHHAQAVLGGEGPGRGHHGLVTSGPRGQPRPAAGQRGQHKLGPMGEICGE